LARAVLPFFEEAHAGDGGADGELRQDVFHGQSIAESRYRTRDFLRFLCQAKKLKIICLTG
jgi:hypothetical protein